MAERHVPVSMGSELSTTMELPGLRITDVRFPSCAWLPDHTHDRAVFAVALDGFLDSRLPGRHLDCDALCVWTEPAGERHSNRVGGGGARVLVIMPDPASEDPHRACARMLDEVNHWHDRGIAGIAWRMAAELRVGDSPARLALNGLALEALALALRGRTCIEDRESMPAWLKRARDFVHDRYRQALELSEIADEIGVEPALLARAFRARFGTPLGTYQRRLRLDWAAAELAATEEPLGRVALRAGFYDQAHFTRHFRRHTGQTPGQYRRTHRV
jgi:AraC family transcriptional regulator